MPPPDSGRKVLALLCALAFVNYLDRSLVFPLLSPIARDLGVAPGALGALATAFDVVYACSAPLVGMLADRAPRKRLLLGALIAWTLATGLTGLATGFLSLLVLRSATGLAEGGYFPTALSVIGDTFPARRRSRAIALHCVFATLGGSAGYAFAGLAGERWGWRAPFLLALIPGLLLAVVFARWFAPAASNAPARPAAPAHARRGLLAIARSPDVLLLALASCLAAFTMSGLGTFLPLYLTEAYGVPVGRAGVLAGVVFATTLVGQLTGGTLSDRIGARVPGGRPLCVAIAYAGMAPAAAAMGHAGGVAAVLVAYAASQLLRGVAEPGVYGTILDATRPEERGAAQGFLIALTFVGCSAAGATVGAIIRAHGFTTAFHVIGGVALAASGCAAALTLRQRRAHALVPLTGS